MTLISIAAAGIFFWAGCVVAISFLEAWLKFRAPGVTLAIGLSIGRIVFGALNKLEWVFGVVTAVLLVTGGRPVLGASSLWLSTGVLMLLLETVWLLPALDRRAVSFIEGQRPGGGSLHIVFVAAEVVKVAALVLAGVNILTTI